MHVALSGLSFKIEPGSVVGLLGRNGAGKSTCLRILAGVLRPTSGSVLIAGIDAQRDCALARSKVGYLAETAPLYPELRVEEYLRFRAELKGTTRTDRKERIAFVLNQVHAEALRDVRCSQLSRGYQKRVSLADALLTDPEVLLLDEPTAGLDPTQNRETRELIARLGRTRTVIVSTHVLAEVEAMCGSALLIDEGKLVAQGSIDALLAERETTELTITVRGDAEKFAEVLPALHHVIETIELGSDLYRLKLRASDPNRLDAIAEETTEKLVRSGLFVRELQRSTTSLEQVFAALTQRNSVE
jgi:ABC-2 type transport system ATP-binding protein